MGDAGPSVPTSPTQDLPLEITTSGTSIREIHVLVTGFGAFKSFTTNPSYLIASSLPDHLDPLPAESFANFLKPPPVPLAQPALQHPLAALLGRPAILIPKVPEPPPVPQPIRTPNSQPYRIRIHSYPSPLYVAYAPTSTIIPSLLDPRTNSPYNIDFDYIFHIGLASGRDSYTLETNAHRDDYDIKDVDEQAGYLTGEKVWKSLNPRIPDRLDAGWFPADVLAKWECEVERRQTINERGLDRVLAEMSRGDTSNGSTRDQILNNTTLRQRLIQGNGTGTGTVNTKDQPILRQPRRAIVKLSRDAGRYLCEFILMCSLVYRYRDARGDFEHEQTQSTDDNEDVNFLRKREHASEKIGKVAFLHVPNGTEPEDIERGKMVAESAIQALVASWEAGYRNPLVYSLRQTISKPIDRAQLAVMGEDIDATPSLAANKPYVLAPLNLGGLGTMNVVGESGFETKGTGDS